MKPHYNSHMLFHGVFMKCLTIACATALLNYGVRAGGRGARPAPASHRPIGAGA